MTDTPRSLDPAHVDELLSADLDGELAGAASDLGYDVDDVRAQISANPGLRARREALDRARHELASFAPLDEVTAARLRSNARDELPAPKRTRLYAIVGGIAAAIAIVVAVVAVASSRSANNNTTKTAAAAPTVPSPTTGVVHSGAPERDFGTANDIDALAAGLKTTQGYSAASAPVAAGQSPPTPFGDGALSSKQNASSSAAKSATSCPTVAQQAAGSAAQLVEHGVATVGGQPVTIWIYSRAGAPDLLVALNDACSLVATRPLGRTSR